MSIDMTLQKYAIFIMGVYGEISHVLSSRFWLHKKRWNTSWKFQFQKASNKTGIAKKYLTNLYEMNSSFSGRSKADSPNAQVFIPVPTEEMQRKWSRRKHIMHKDTLRTAQYQYKKEKSIGVNG